jgi:HK97 family phage major capsid protein
VLAGRVGRQTIYYDLRKGYFGMSQADAMIVRIQKEIDERSAFIEGVIANAQDGERDLTDNEKELTVQARGRIESLDDQLKHLSAARERTMAARQRAQDVEREISRMRSQVDNGQIEYRSAGAFMLDYYAASIGNTQARERLEIFERAAAHQKTSDNLGVIPEPVVGPVLNFVDASRPAVGFLGAQPLPSATWYRPKVTQRTLVGVQGSAGGAADEKSELVSQKMTITRITGNAVTYGGYVNVSRQDIDFSTPQILDIITNDLAAQYAIQTEAALGTVIQGVANNVELATASGGVPTAQHLTDGLWTAVGNVYTATKGIGRIALIVPPSRLANWGSVFSPVNPQNSQSTGFNAADFGSGPMGNISGIPVYCSPGYPTVANYYGSLVSSAAIEVYETRIGALQVIEPSVLGVQIAYAGYFTPMTVESGGVQRIVNLA